MTPEFAAQVQLLIRSNPFPNQQLIIPDPRTHLKNFGEYPFQHLFTNADMLDLESRYTKLMSGPNHKRALDYNIRHELFNLSFTYDFAVATKIVSAHLGLPEKEVAHALIPLTAHIGRVLERPIRKFCSGKSGYADDLHDIRVGCKQFQDWVDLVNNNPLTCQIGDSIPTREQILELRRTILSPQNPFENLARMYFPNLPDLGVDILSHVVPSARAVSRAERAIDLSSAVLAAVEGLAQCSSMPVEVQQYVRLHFKHAMKSLTAAEIRDFCLDPQIRSRQLITFTSSHIVLAHEYVRRPIVVFSRQQNSLSQRILSITDVHVDDDLEENEIAIEFVCNKDEKRKQHLINFLLTVPDTYRGDVLQFLAVYPYLLTTIPEIIKREVSMNQISDFIQAISEIEPHGKDLEKLIHKLHENSSPECSPAETFAWLIRNAEISMTVFKDCSVELAAQVLGIYTVMRDPISTLKGVKLLVNSGKTSLIGEYLTKLYETPHARNQAIADTAKLFASKELATPLSATSEPHSTAVIVEILNESEAVTGFRKKIKAQPREVQEQFDLFVEQFKTHPLFDKLLSSRRLSNEFRRALTTGDGSRLQKLEQALTATMHNESSLVEISEALFAEDTPSIIRDRIINDRGIPSSIGPIVDGQVVYLFGWYGNAAQRAFYDLVEKRGYRPQALRVYDPNEVDKVKNIPPGSTVIEQIKQSHSTYGYIKLLAQRSGARVCHLNQSGQDAVIELLNRLFPEKPVFADGI